MKVTAINHPLPVVQPFVDGGNTGIVPPWLREPFKILPVPGPDDPVLPVEPEVPASNGLTARMIDTAFDPWPLEG